MFEINKKIWGNKTSAAQDMALAHWLYTANEKAYESEIITKPMYEYARDELCKSVSAAEKRYDIPSGEAGDAIGLIENPPSAG